ncbi:glycerate kinase [Falsibacillus pallidus]|uniref:Glycerate kinase n=1 Tax=Falsibacillus pallidus TaxID=493781 RepID=A0A370GDI0_9BACI|nr:glycerate kinase [Falsibacillus pallidus]RDI41875.1 glycerate kinase [Falsibacillus pallidus]
MKIVIASDSFKGSLSALQASAAMEKGIKKVMPDADVMLIPVGDGGEGTMDSLISAVNGKAIEVDVHGPLHTMVKAAYGLLDDGKTGVIEMASASGLDLVLRDERNPMITSTFGTGELIKKALDDGCRRMILAIGGSATNDGGIGMLQALGMKLLDSNGEEVGRGGQALKDIHSIDDSKFDRRIADAEFIIASDVQNPLIGPHGASRVFGPQKGADPQMTELLDQYLTQWADLVQEKTGIKLHDRPGAGAAGGLGGAFQAFFPAVMRRGIDIVIEQTGLKEKLSGADLVLTGEGKIDSQTIFGKTPMGVAQEAQKQGIPVIALAGSVGRGIEELYSHGITSIHSIVDGPMNLNEAMEKGSELLEFSAEQVFRTYLASKTK